ncbi:MAG: prolipoprotein diacylglyceryl transferase, partial [Pirellulaceae bacterium]
MQQTLFFIPHELGGIPVFGWGWLLAGWWLGSAVWLIWTLSRHRDATAVVGFAPFFLVVSAAIMFLFPMLEAKDPQGAPLGLPVRGYGTLVLAGFVVAFLWATRRAEQRGMSGETISSLALWLFVAGFAGARLFFVIEYWDDFRRPNLGETIRAVATFTEGGLVVYGALIAALPTLAVFAWRHRVTPLELGDVVAPTLLAGLALGRIGCLMNGCCYGG